MSLYLFLKKGIKTINKRDEYKASEKKVFNE